jgi:hypothetical protein
MMRVYNEVHSLIVFCFGTMKVESLTQSVCDLALGFGEGGDQKSMVRQI